MIFHYQLGKAGIWGKNKERTQELSDAGRFVASIGGSWFVSGVTFVIGTETGPGRSNGTGPRGKGRTENCGNNSTERWDLSANLEAGIKDYHGQVAHYRKLRGLLPSRNSRLDVHWDGRGTRNTRWKESKAS